LVQQGLYGASCEGEELGNMAEETGEVGMHSVPREPKFGCNESIPNGRFRLVEDP
jgi:hypothetical protein